MRWLLLCGLALGITAGAYATSAIAAPPADGPGCLGVTAEECVRWLRATMTLDESFLAASLARRHQVDVNGRPLGPGLVTIDGKLPGRLEQFVILLHLGPDDRVHSVESNLLLNLIEVHTEEVYDQSALYDIVWRLVGRRCPGIAKLELYRFFENSVKPRITHQQEDLSSGLHGLHRMVSHAGGVPFCGGVTLAYTNLLQWRGAANPAAAAKRTQFSSIELQ
ncbi:MAG: hypothetical protein WA459_03500 [Stellaceae bacterium]